VFTDIEKYMVVVFGGLIGLVSALVA